MRGEVAKYVSELAARAADFKPIWGSVENVLRPAMRGQLESSSGPHGESYAPLKSSTLGAEAHRATRAGAPAISLGRRRRRSPKPYDTMSHKTWNMFAQKAGGVIIRASKSLAIKIPTKGAFYVGGGTKYMQPRPVGPSEAAADEIVEIVADYLIAEDKQPTLPGIF